MHSLRAGNLIAFAIFIALTLGASRVAHVVSNKTLLDKVRIFRGKAQQNDDIAIMTIRLITT